MIFKIGKSMNKVQMSFDHGFKRWRGEHGRCRIEWYMFGFCILDFGFTRHDKNSSSFYCYILGFGFDIGFGPDEF